MGTPRGNNGTGRAGTFEEQLRLLGPQLNQALFAKAHRASRIAKCLKGAQRRRAYRIKNRALRDLIERGAARTELDWWHTPGLVSVALDQDHRLHTRSAWLRDA